MKKQILAIVKIISVKNAVFRHGVVE